MPKKTQLAADYVVVPTTKMRELLAYQQQRAELSPAPIQSPQPKQRPPLVLHRIGWREPLLWFALCLLSVGYGITRALRHY